MFSLSGLGESFISSVHLNVCTVLKYMCTDVCARQRDRVNITIPSVGAVQVLSYKQKISAKLGEEGDL